MQRTKWGRTREGRGSFRPGCRSVTCKRRVGKSRSGWWDEPPTAAQFQESFGQANGESSTVGQSRSSRLTGRASCPHQAQSLAGAAFRKRGLGGDMVGPLSYATYSKQPEQHAAMAAVDCVTPTSGLTNKCGFSDRLAQLFCLASCTAALKTTVNPSALGGP